MSTRSDAVCDTSGEAGVEAHWWRRPTAAYCFYNTTLRLFNQRQEASPPPLSIRCNTSKNKNKKKKTSHQRRASTRRSPRQQTKFPSVVTKRETTMSAVVFAVASDWLRPASNEASQEATCCAHTFGLRFAGLATGGQQGKEVAH